MQEGLRRIAAVLRWAGYALLAMAVIVFVVNLSNTRSAGEAVFAALIVGIFSIPLLTVAWIIEGFAKR